jgi:hypothetical protein
VEKINDLLKDYDVDDSTPPRGRYIEVPTQPVQWVSADGKSMGASAAMPLVGCRDCGSVVWDAKAHDRDHARKRQSRAGL